MCYKGVCWNVGIILSAAIALSLQAGYAGVAWWLVQQAGHEGR